MHEAAKSSACVGRVAGVAEVSFAWRRRAACALLVSLCAGAAAAAGLSDGGGDEVAASRRLRERAATLRRPAGTALTADQDVGHIAVMEHDGSNYDRNEPDGTPNYAPRAALAQRFYQTHGDLYDFLVVFTNFEFETGPALAFYNLVRNDVQGIGKPLVDNGPLFGSPGRLRGYVDMAALDRYGRSPLSTRPGVPLSTQPGDAGFRDTLNVLAHEIGHQWLAFVRYRDGAGGASPDLLGRDGAHWSYLLDSDASVMYGSDWLARPEGVYRAARVLEGYSALDRYLMGFVDPAHVPPFSLLRNPAVDAAQLPREGDEITATPEAVVLSQVVAAEGARTPGFAASPKEFRVGFIFLTAPGTSASSDDLAAVERVREAFAAHFFELTAGVAVADTTLAETPPGPPAQTPDLERALQWLLGRQLADGRWEDASGSAVRDTTASVDALRDAGLAGTPYDAALDWLRAARVPNTDFVARRAASLAATLAPDERGALAQDVWQLQNRDGGFGVAAGYESDAFDTALAVRALAALGWQADVKLTRALLYLSASRLAGGGWPAVAGGATSTVATAQALLALQDYATHVVAQPLLAPGLAVLAARRNLDGGFGDGASTPYAGALVLRALLRGGAPASVVDPTVAWLQRTQLDDGSWNASPYQTALVLAALKGGITPNLVVPADSLVLAPSPAREGQVVHVTALVRNSGRRVAPPTRARLYDGHPGDPQNAIADVPVGELQPGEEAAVAFDYPTLERAGNHTVYVVADADGEAYEAREDDNAASRALLVTGRLPDLALRTGDLDVVPYPPQDGEQVELRVQVRNQGERASAPSLVRVYRGNPRLGGVVIGAAPLPGLALGASAVVSIAWDTTGAQGEHELFAVADPDWTLDESDDTNNETNLPVTVTGPVPPDPDLEVVRVALDPPVQVSIPQPLLVRVLVRNLGREPVASSVRLSDDQGTQYGDLPLSLGPRSATTLEFAVSVTAGGDRTFTALADPDGTLPEPNEGNNQASAMLDDTASTFDVEVRASDVTPSSTDLVIGQTLEVSVVVRNHGTGPIVGLPLQLVHALPTPVELARVFVDVPPGGVTSATLAWETGITGTPLPLAVVADPFDLLPELSETNNRADFAVDVTASDLPNLATSGADVTFVPDPPLEGAPAQVRAVVRNTGAVPAASFVVEFWRGDPDENGLLIGSATVDGLEAGAQATAEVTWATVDVRGAQGLFVRVDPGQQIEEFNENDNNAFRPFTALGLPDLVLTVGDVSLQPGYPRAGEAVTVRARVRNLGLQTSAPATLHAAEGETNGGVTIADVPVPALAPGQFALLSFSWTPAAPAGERALVLVADSADVVREQDEGNNRARRTVVVQDANLYLTEPYFSPDGDGAKDETSLAWRATGTSSVSVVVSNSRGKAIRTLLSAGPAEGSVAWDGRDARGRLMWDGRYTFTLKAHNGAVLGRREALLDTNRSPIHDAAGTGLAAVRNLTCALPQLHHGPVFTPAEDEALFILNYHDEETDLAAGLLRVGSDGQFSYVGVPDPWYENASFPFNDYDQRPSAPTVRLSSPDGREVLVRHNFSELWAVDVSDGTRRLVSDSFYADSADWSPDGGKLLLRDRVLRRDGSEVGFLPCCGGFRWSPDGSQLVQGNRIYTPEGEFVKEIPLPDSLFSPASATTGFYGSGADWRGDGKIFVGGSAPEGALRGSSFGSSFFLLDPETDTSEELFWLGDLYSESFIDNFDWSPDGTKLAYRGFNQQPNAVPIDFDLTRVTREDGRFTRLLSGGRLTPGPNDTVASFERSGEGEVCNGFSETYALFNLQNLTADLQVSRLPANNGLMLRGTASDLWLDHYQLEYRRESEPESWHPIGAAGDVPVISDDFTVWVPAAPGRYVVRLSVVDRAGNLRSRSRVVNWTVAPAIVNISQSEVLISPNGDGRRDAVRFDYLVQEPARLEVRVAGPERAGQAAPVVRRFSFEYPDLGPAFFVWDGRDSSGQVVPDGRYTVFLGELPFRVTVDTTPPDHGFSESEPVLKVEQITPREARVYVGLTRSMHVVDPHLKAWLAPEGEGARQVYAPELDENGEIVYDERGVPVIAYVDGHAADAVEDVEIDGNVERLAFVAEDLAGNVSQRAEPARPEKLFLLLAMESDGRQRLVPPRVPEDLHPLRPPEVTFLLATTALEPASPVFFRFQRETGGAWTEVPASFEWLANFEEIGVAFGVIYRGEFVQRLANRELRTDVFRFRVCDAAADLKVKSTPVTPQLTNYRSTVTASVGEPITSVKLTVTGLGRLNGFRQEVTLAGGNGSYLADVLGPKVGCEEPDDQLAFAARVTGESGRVYEGNLGCLRLAGTLPVCPNKVRLKQLFFGCSQTPDDVFLRVDAESDASDARVFVERGPVDAPVVLAELRPPVSTMLRLDVRAEAQGGFPVRARLQRASQNTPLATHGIEARVDRTPPEALILEPAEGATQCVARDPQTGDERLRVRLMVDDGLGDVELGPGSFQFEDGPWRALNLSGGQPCTPTPDDPRACRRVPINEPFDRLWDVSGLSSGPYGIDQTFCDGAGNRTNELRHFTLSKQPPYLTVDSISRRVFSPNGDGRAEDTLVTIGLAQALRLTVEVRRGGPGGALVKRLVDDQTYFAGQHPFTWDGRDGTGLAQSDGDYYVVASGLDGCLNTGRVWARVTVDVTPPVTLVTRPADAQHVSTTTDVRGQALDKHFAQYELAFGLGLNPSDWTVIEVGGGPVGALPLLDGPLGLWTPPNVPGPAPEFYTLRLQAADVAENLSEARVTVSVGPRVFLDHLAAEPLLFSPNDDGRRETQAIEYQILLPGRVTLQARTLGGTPLRTFEQDALREAGTYAFVWDGLRDDATPTPEGDLQIFVRVDDPQGGPSFQQETLLVALDRTPPTLSLTQPAEGAYVDHESGVTGSVDDPRLTRWRVSATDAGGALYELAEGTDPRDTATLATLDVLADGRYTLVLSAEDAAENRALEGLQFTVDSIPPEAGLDFTPRQVLRRGSEPIPVKGRATDLNFEEYVLSFGAGEAPGHFVELARGTTGGVQITLGQWAVAGVPDGVYTLQLAVTDKAGHTTEAREVVVLDGTPPEARIDEPQQDSYVTGETPVTGDATDANLASWLLEVAPGPAAQAYQWATLGEGDEAVTGGLLADWAPLPADGIYTLRLTAKDRAGFSTSALRSVIVDTTPPAPPTGLAAEVLRDGGPTGDVRLTWNANSEPDLEGYFVYRDGEEISDLLHVTQLLDLDLVDGTFRYEVTAIDKAGNESDPAPLPVRVDLTPPIADIVRPLAGARVSGSLDVRGTAFSPDDFKEYRLSVGPGAEPTSFTLLRRATLGVAGGVLGTWTAVGDGPFTLKLEAEDTSGNLASDTVTVVVDNDPPAPPALTAVENTPLPTSLTSTWTASTSPDVDGYLLERNGQIANAPGVVVGDLRPYLLPGPSYADADLPDGEHCYRVTAMDEAGNLSAPSNQICRALDNHPPHVVLLEPPNGLRFDYPLELLGFTLDTDVASVTFQYKASASATWLDVGPADTQTPWQITFDPLPLAFGDYDLRAVATDTHGNLDPAPESITVTYGDATAPGPPHDLTARVDGDEVALTWTANSETDLAGYNVYRDGDLLTPTPQAATTWDDILEPGLYRYVVTAVDEDGNESAPASDEARVYQVTLAQPYPVTAAQSADLAGDGAQPDTSVDVERADLPVATVAIVDGGRFLVPGVPLELGANFFVARGADAAGNRSIPSDEVVLIANAPPPPVTDLSASVSDHDVELSWTSVVDPELAGFVLMRGATSLTPSVPQTDSLSVSATSWANNFVPQNAFDGNPATQWIGGDDTATWTVQFPSTVLVDKLTLHFASIGSLPTAAAYRIEAAWEGRFLPLVDVKDNTATTVEHVLPSAFLTDALRVVLLSGPFVGLSELDVSRRAVLGPADVGYLDEDAPDGTHTYRVSAIDRYGFEGQAAVVTLAVGDTLPPGRPTGLTASVTLSDVQLIWDANPEPDIDHYVVVRDGERIGTSPTPSYLDAGRPNGTYVYAVLAVDHEGQESEPSDPATAVVERTDAPGAPVIFVPTDAAHPITISATQTPVRGRADPGTLVSLDVNGVLAGVVPTSPAFAEVGRWSNPPLAISTTLLDPDGAHVLYARWVPELGQYGLFRRDLGNGAETQVGAPSPFWLDPRAVSADGSKLAYRASDRLFVVDVASGASTALDVSPGSGDWMMALSADSRQVAFVAYFFSGGWRYSLRVRDLVTGVQRQLVSSTVSYVRLAFSPQGDKLAAVVYNPSAGRYELRLIDVASGAQSVIDTNPWYDSQPSWSADGTRLLFTRYVAGLARVSFYTRATGLVSDVTNGLPPAWDGRFDRDGTWLSFVRQAPSGPFGEVRATLVARKQADGQEQSVAEFDIGYQRPLQQHEWVAGGYLHAELGNGEIAVLPSFPGAFSFASVALVPGLNELVARATNVQSGLTGPDSLTVEVTVSDGVFPDLVVEGADLDVYPAVPLAGQSVRLSTRVRNVGEAEALDVPVTLDLLDAQGDVILTRSLQVSALPPGASAQVTAFWTPQAAGAFRLRGSADAANFIVESNEANNSAEHAIAVQPATGGVLAASLTSDRESYPAHTLALVQGEIFNGGPTFSGSARLTLETRDGEELALVDERMVSLAHGASLLIAAQWNSAATYAGDYRFALRVFAPGALEASATATRDFVVVPDVQTAARLTAERASVPYGQPAGFAARVDNLGANAPLDGLQARFSIAPAGGASLFALETAVPRLFPGGQWPTSFAWPVAQPAGDYVARLEVRAAAPASTLLAWAEAPFSVAPAPAVSLSGTLRLMPADVLAGGTTTAQVSVTNQGSQPLTAQPFSVLLTAGSDPTPVVSTPFTLDLAPGQTRTVDVALDSAALSPGFYPAFLRSVSPARTLARARLHVHGLIAPPSLDAPAEGATIATSHPTLSVNNGSTPEGAPLTYEYQLFADAALQVPLPGMSGVPETPLRTAWTVDTNLGEDHTYYWRARASDGFSTSAWMAVASFTVDTENLPPSAPLVDSPAPGSRVATSDVSLVVRNAQDPEVDALTYEFVLASDLDLTTIVASATGVPEGPGLTSWHVPVALSEDATYYWAARASDGANLSPWTSTASFTVDTVNAAPTAPTPLAPIGGVSIATQTPELRAANASDPEGDPLRYTFQVDRVPSFDSPDLQVSPAVPETPLETSFTPATLADNTLWYWRVSAHDGHSSGPWAGSSFFVNLGNDPPSTPVLLNPPDGGIVATPTPDLRVRNATDPDRDTLTYDFEVRDGAQGVVASASGVTEGLTETFWTVTPALLENQIYTWAARASDGQVQSAWSTVFTFRVNAVPDPPTAPGLIAPAEGAVVAVRRPDLVVSNAQSPEGLSLTYTFELYRVVAGVPTLFAQASGVPSGASNTSFTPTLDLPDGDYSWRARAVDANQAGPWMPSARFSVAVDVPPAAPTGLVAVPGNAQVSLSWNASPEPDVVGYRIYRSLVAGGPYTALGDVLAPHYVDLGLTNGVTYRYVVTALDAAFESARSNEAAATPQGGGGPLSAEVRYTPNLVHGECILVCKFPESPTDDRNARQEPSATRPQDAGRAVISADLLSRLAARQPDGDIGYCPWWIFATIELPPGVDPLSIDVPGLLINGVVGPDPGYWRVVDSDEDGIPELETAWEFYKITALLQVGANVLTLSGTAGGQPFSGSDVFSVLAPAVSVRITPRTIQTVANGRWVNARLSLGNCGSNWDFEVGSLRLNETVPVAGVVSRPGLYDIIVKFDRAAVHAVLPLGDHVEVRVSGKVRGLPFVARDYVKVLP